MAYLTAQDLRDRFGEREIDLLLDRDANGLPDTGTADAAIADASGEADAILGARYPLPLPATAWLKAAVADLARARLYDQQPPDAVTSRRDAALRIMRDIARGNGVLVDEQGQPLRERGESLAGGGATHRAKPRVFGDDNLQGYV
ncbi:MAG: gp436 family protein [Halomonas sp.]